MLDDDNMEQEDFDETESETSSSTQPIKEDKQKGTISADLIRGHINTIILRSLSERDKYGYEIIEEIEKKSHGQYELKQPTLYSALKRLENQGYIKAYWKTDEISAGGRRKYYTLTESGKDITEKNRAEWEYSRTVIDSLISDQEFDFSKPAPNPVDFKILKQSTSRVPTVKLEETREKNTDEDNQTVVAYSYSEVNSQTINLDAAQLQFEESNEEQSTNDTIVTDTTADTYQQTQTEEAISSQTQSQSQSQNNSNNDSVESIETVNIAELNQTTQTAETAEVVENNVINDNLQVNRQTEQMSQPEQPEQVYTSEIHEQQASYFRSESIEQAYGDQYNQYEQYQETTPQMQSVQMQSISSAQNNGNTAAEAEQYKRQHENYLKLIDNNYVGNGQRKVEPEYGENLDTDKLIYINKPETERDYKNLVNDIYSQTLKPQNTVTAPVNESINEIYEQAVPTTPVVEQSSQEAQSRQSGQTTQPIQQQPSKVFYEVQSEESRRAESDGLKIFTSDRQPKPNGKYTRNFNLGYALFKSAAVTFAYLMVIFIITLCCKSALGVSLVYPFVIFGLACCLFAICAVIAISGFGRNSVKPVSHGYIGVCAVLTVIAILIVCVLSILLEIDFSSGADVCIKIVIPSITLLAAPLYSVMFYIFSK